ncbi:uncharacterized protein [Periplaneta americana]|uniref:uncharacterized protein n=1 Tax=Periplaneta americana TaxID=6978 RepID=UPI0037E724BB
MPLIGRLAGYRPRVLGDRIKEVGGALRFHCDGVPLTADQVPYYKTMRTSLLIFVLAAFVPFFFVEAASDTTTKEPKPGEVTGQLVGLLEKVIWDVKDPEENSKLGQTKYEIGKLLLQWNGALHQRYKKKVKKTYEQIMERIPQFLDVASPENKGELLINHFPSTDAKLRRNFYL